ncbi:MAG: uncharacterized protein JWN95_952 [Frankiales bacterium]|nr:uncharacterized protein [Frankiales bacterium]
MAFPEKLLAEDEEIVEHLHPHWLTLVPAVLSFIVVCALAGVAIAFLPDSTDHHNAHQYLLIAIIVVGLVLILWFTLAPVLRWRSTHYVITTHRVLIRRGVLKHRGRDITLGRISDVSYEQSLSDRIFRSGSLSIESASENGQETLVNIPRADKIQQTLNRLVEADSTRRSRPYDTGGFAQGAPLPPSRQQPDGYPTSQYPPEQGPGDTTRYR